MENVPKDLPVPSIRELVDKIRGISIQFQIVSLNRQIEACENLLKENPPIDVAILGQFKAGKSSFINSLTEKPILPVGVIPVTTVITRLQYGERERAIVTYFDGANTEVKLEDLQDFTSEANNPANQKNVYVVDIELPSLENYSGIRLVDTPGMGSVFKYHMEVSKNWLPEVGAAILAVSADRPLSEHDLDLISDLMHHTPKIIILLTKADLLTHGQQTEVVQFFQQTLKKELNREIPIFLYSTRTNTESFKHQIETEVLSDLSVNRDIEFKRIIGHKTQTLIKRCISYLDLALQTSLKADQDHEALRSQILNEKVNYDLIREEIDVIARENQRQTRIFLMNYLERFHRLLTKKLKDKLAEEIPSWSGNLWKLTRQYESWITENMTEEIGYISKTENKHFLGTHNKAYASLSRYLETFKALLDDTIHRVLGIRLAEADWEISVVEPDHPDVKVLYAFDFHFDLIWFLIPMVIFRKVFEKHFLNEIPRTVEINLSRLAAQWEDRINRAIDKMHKQTVQYIKEELSTIDALLSKTHGQTSEIRALTDELKQQCSFL